MRITMAVLPLHPNPLYKYTIYVKNLLFRNNISAELEVVVVLIYFISSL
jgi:hypothetical protein